MATETLVPGDVEAVAITELGVRMPSLGYPGLPTATTTPNPRPAEFIRLFSTGGFSEDLVADSFTLILEAYSDRKGRAERICAFALAALQAAGRDGGMGALACRRVEVFSLPANLPDPQVPDSFRFTATISVVLRRTAV